MELVVVGVPVVAGPAAGWNFWPLVAIPLALLLAFRWLKLPRLVGVVVGAILLGLLTADAISRWGVIPVMGTAVTLAAILTVALGRIRRSPPTV